jgi:hypothetical protein
MNITLINLFPKTQVFWDVPLFRRSCLRFEGYDGVFFIRLKQSTRLDAPEGGLSPTPLWKHQISQISCTCHHFIFIDLNTGWKPENRGSIPVEGKHYSVLSHVQARGLTKLLPNVCCGFSLRVKLEGVKLTTSIWCWDYKMLGAVLWYRISLCDA